MATAPVLATEFLWRIVKDSRWNGYQANGFVADVFSVYVGWRIPYIAKANKNTLRIQVPESRSDHFRHLFSDAEIDKHYGQTRNGLVMLRLPIPREAQ